MEDNEEDLSNNDKLEKKLIDKHEYYTQVGLWPATRKLNYNSWLKNFSETDKKYALTLLSNFKYINDEYCDELLKEAFIQASQLEINYLSSEPIQNQWKNFFESCIICPVRGEQPSLADSGYSYVQKARDIFGIDENQFMEPDEALKLRFNNWLNSKKTNTIIFVDDFIGSGNQFHTMWNKTYDLFNVECHSHETLSYKTKTANIYYCCMLATETGIEMLINKCFGLKICVGHIIQNTDSIFHNESTVWNGKMQRNGIKKLKELALTYKMPDTSGRDTHDWKGFYELGLLLGIRNRAPDATIGAIRWNENGWQPLIK